MEKQIILTQEEALVVYDNLCDLCGQFEDEMDVPLDLDNVMKVMAKQIYIK